MFEFWTIVGFVKSKFYESPFACTWKFHISHDLIVCRHVWLRQYFCLNEDCINLGRH